MLQAGVWSLIWELRSGTHATVYTKKRERERERDLNTLITQPRNRKYSESKWQGLTTTSLACWSRQTKSRSPDSFSLLSSLAGHRDSPGEWKTNVSSAEMNFGTNARSLCKLFTKIQINQGLWVCCLRRGNILGWPKGSFGFFPLRSEWTSWPTQCLGQYAVLKPTKRTDGNQREAVTKGNQKVSEPFCFHAVSGGKHPGRKVSAPRNLVPTVCPEQQ